MSASFRPVVEKWGEYCPLFIEHEQLLALFDDLAARVGVSSEECRYGDVCVIWFADGRRILDYMAHDCRFNPDSLRESLGELGLDVSRTELAVLIDNMRTLAATEWRGSIEGDGSLRFYMD